MRWKIGVLLVLSIPIILVSFIAFFLLLPLYIFMKFWHYCVPKSRSMEKYTKDRSNDLSPIFSKMIPKDVNSALDIGSGRKNTENYAKKFFKKYTTLDIYNADIIQDLNINTKINLPSNSVDIVIISNILEHLVNPFPVALEANRIARKYVLLGLPNEYPLDERLIVLFGIYDDFVYPYGHKHRLSLKSISQIVCSIWGSYISRVYKFHSIGGRFIPSSVKSILMGLFPSLFVGEVFYLIKKNKIRKKVISPWQHLL